MYIFILLFILTPGKRINKTVYLGKVETRIYTGWCIYAYYFLFWPLENEITPVVFIVGIGFLYPLYQILDTRSSSHYPSAEDELHFLIKGGGDVLTYPLVLLVTEYIILFVEGGPLIIRLHWTTPWGSYGSYFSCCYWVVPVTAGSWTNYPAFLNFNRKIHIKWIWAAGQSIFAPPPHTPHTPNLHKPRLRWSVKLTFPLR